MKIHKQSIDSYIEKRKKSYYDEIYQFLVEEGVATVADVGGATGDFAWFAPETLQIKTFDVSQELIGIAKKTRSKQNLAFECLDCTKEHIGSFDAVTLFGTLSTMNDLDCVKRLCNSAKKYIIIHSMLNKFPFDVLISHREYKQTSGAAEDYVNSFNLFSANHVLDIIRSSGFSIRVFKEMVMDEKIMEGEEESLNVFHVNVDGKKMLANHLGVVFDEYLVIACKS